MESTIENHSEEVTPQSLHAAWQHFKEVWSASSGSQAWSSFKKMVEALPVWALVLGVIVTAVVQFVIASRWGNDQLLVSNNLETASLWLGRDAVEAASFTPGGGTVYGTLNWSDASNQFRYSYNPLAGELVREHLQGGSVQSTRVVARSIAAQGDVSFTVTGDLLTVSLTVTSGDVNQSTALDFRMRSQ